MQLEKLKYPIGHFKSPDIISKEILKSWIADISSFPARLNNEIAYLTEEQLDTHYRPNGWTIRQVIHHCADSHTNSLIRFKLALTEDKPTIKPYFEDRWAELVDSKIFSINSSIKILEGTHQRWVCLLNHLSIEELKKTFIHPQHGKAFGLNQNIGIYAWHCNHHLAHITMLKRRNGWQ